MHKYHDLFPQMRSLQEKVDKGYEKIKWFLPQNTIPAGSEHIGLLAKTQAREAILRGLRLEKSFEEIKKEGIQAYKLVIERWNSQREWQVHRSDCFAETFVGKIINEMETR